MICASKWFAALQHSLRGHLVARFTQGSGNIGFQGQFLLCYASALWTPDGEPKRGHVGWHSDEFRQHRIYSDAARV
jgi:hypothetical protein